MSSQHAGPIPTDAQVDAAMRVYFESGPDGGPGRYDHVADHIKARNRPRFVAALAAALGAGATPLDVITVPRPRVPFGPDGVDPDIATADYLLEAADKLETHYRPFGSNLRATVVQLLRDAAGTLRQSR